ncbi:ABC transporter ATP-binding protein [Streptomyces sp. CMB-StM0423]|uniref:ABC transporter ATP-binding protein n=1 Tax=Streptomyces sp. CMB-StM0423 TaxID=2059884 RepID=UPI000C6FF014|nr:ATP-binding cassette domain-containing protein [Streptomyces sp. CMB-StM0423]AUH42099.1 export ABC transporter ATP-binding protein [Streptomyces sp. CMB-StM0423]
MTEVEVRGLTKVYGDRRAVDEVSFTAPSGRVTGFLGPNGAGKTTTLRMALGLVHPTAGEAFIGGLPYRELVHPRRSVGALLEATGFHSGRSGRAHLRILARICGVGETRVNEVLELVELGDAAGRRAGGYSLGMRQRLGLAAAMIGDPGVLVLDEPANGLDPAGMAWLRALLRSLAADGRTVLVSSHVLSEVAQTVDHVVIISRGRTRFDGALEELGSRSVSVRTPHAARLRDLLGAQGYEAVAVGEARLDVRGTSAEDIGRIAAEAGVVLSGLSEGGASLEEAFLKLTEPEPESEPGTPAGRVVAAAR